MMPSSDTPERSGGSQLRRYGPVLAIVVIVAVIAAVLVLSGGGGDDDDTAGGGDTSSTTAAGDGETGGDAPEGAVSFSQAEEEGIEVEWSETCDTETGRLAIPFFFVPECYAPHEGDNGGATAKGVTGDTIKVVLYLRDENDAVYNYIVGAIGNTDSVAAAEETYRGYVDFFESYYETYGRKVELEVLHASGQSNDEVAARADAVRAAEDMGAFAVWGGPILGSAFADELAARGVVCIGCSGGSLHTWYEERAPFIYTVARSGEQAQDHTVEYVSKTLAGEPAEHAGDPAYQGQERKFGYLYIESNDESAALADQLVDRLAEEGVEIVERVPYQLDPGRLQEQATSAIAKLKDAGVTSVIFNGDPVAPGPFTTEATAQEYFPEWILTGSALVDTTVFARTYDQQQWAHAFGVSALAARIDPEEAFSYFLYEWHHGEPPPAATTSGVIFPNPSVFYAGVQAAGPNLTPETFRDGLFSLDRPGDAVSQPSVTYGNRGYWPYTDYNGIDDGTEIWWDTDASGPDEVRTEGTGMYRYVDGGKRFLIGDWPDESGAFEEEGSVTIYESVPPDEDPPDYPSPAG